MTGSQVPPINSPLPNRDTNGNLLPDWVRNKLPAGTVSVTNILNMYHAKNVAGKEIMIPQFGAADYVPTFDNIQPTHDCYGRRMKPALARMFSFGDYDILVMQCSERMAYIIYRDINQEPQAFFLPY